MTNELIRQGACIQNEELSVAEVSFDSEDDESIGVGCDKQLSTE